jgi:hypothetical protein
MPVIASANVGIIGSAVIAFPYIVAVRFPRCLV